MSMRSTFWTAVAATLALAGCGAGAGVAPPVVSPSASEAAARLSGALLYVSDTITNDVYVFSYPKGKLLQTITGLYEPGGECADTNRDVFVTNTGGSNIVEYAHGRKRPIATLDDSGAFPIGCAVDPTSGDLAVTNFSSTTSGGGNVVIYKGAKGAGSPYSLARLESPLLCSYDDSGNLFVDGYESGSSNKFVFAELPAGGTKLTRVTLNQAIGNAGGVAWDGFHITVGDQSTNTIYQFKIAGKAKRTGRKVGTVQLSGATQIFQYLIVGSQLVGADAYGASVDIWNYPMGGSAIKTIGGLYAPLGVAVSPGKAR
jgi:hypothetical protein